jgi:hypothetical protein
MILVAVLALLVMRSVGRPLAGQAGAGR